MSKVEKRIRKQVCTVGIFSQFNIKQKFPILYSSKKRILLPTFFELFSEKSFKKAYLFDCDVFKKDIFLNFYLLKALATKKANRSPLIKYVDAA